MGRFLQYVDKMSRITREQQEDAILRIIRENVFFVVDLLTQQLMEGRDGDGNELEHYRSVWYAELKLHLNPRGVTDLKLTGDFHESIFLKTTEWPMLFDASNWKKEKLVSIYGSKILELNNDSIQKLIDHIKGDIIAYYRKLYKL